MLAGAGACAGVWAGVSWARRVRQRRRMHGIAMRKAMLGLSTRRILRDVAGIESGADWAEK